ncbi:MarR family transcriptional regulator [Natronosalvus hydrolyticus]|uniref:MarR family transcriptional regulator n=1 Tax=Natronosalvus hydrolyticus TaxID=2979988 RepID=UPI003CCC6022
MIVIGRGLGKKQKEVLKKIYQRGSMESTGLLAEICGNKSSAKRVLKSLEGRGLVKRIGYGRFRLTPDGEAAVDDFSDEPLL